MSLFSLSFFKSERAKELEKLQIKEQKLKIKLLKKELYENAPEDEKDAGDIAIEAIYIKKPYNSVKLVNDVLTIVLSDGNIIVKPQATQEDFINVRKATTEEEILIITSGKEVVEEKKKIAKETQKILALKDGINKLAKFKDFEIKDESVYLKGIDRSLPQLLIEKFLEIVEKCKTEKILQKNEEYNSHKRFFMWCCLNPRAEVADQLYRFLMKNSFNLTKQGFFVALRNVVTLQTEEDNEIVHFVSNSYNKIKAVWKHSPDKYEVVKFNGEYKLEKTKKNNTEHSGEWIGNLKELYLDLPNMKENRFTDAHTHSFDIRVGKVVNMPMEDCNWNTADCGHSGLHFTADEIHYVGCGDTSVLILINPMKVVGIGNSKGRCYEYLPIMTVPTEEATKILHDLDFDTLELDEQYAIDELANLKEKVKDGFIAEAKKYQFNMPQISNVQVDRIILSLNEMKDEIKNRVQTIV